MTYANASALTVKEPTEAGTSIASMQNPDGTNGNKFPASQYVMLRAKNTNAADRTLTFETPATVRGKAVADPVVTVPATTGDLLVGPFGPEYWQPGTQDVFFTVSATAGLTLDVYRIPHT